MRSLYLRYVLGSRKVAWRNVVGFLAVALFFAVVYLPDFQLASGSKTMVLDGDDSWDVYQETRDYFTDDEYILVAIQPPDAWTPDGIAMVASLTSDLEALPGIDSVLSPATVPLFLSRADETVALHSLTDPEIDLEKARQELTTSPVYVRNVISDDGEVFNMLAYLAALPEGETSREFQRGVVGDVREVMTGYREQGARIQASGLPTVAIDMVDYIEHDIVTFGWAVTLFLLLSLFVFFRRPRFVILPVVTCLITVVSVLGATVALNIETTVVTSNISSLLFIIGMAHSIHLVVAYRESRSAHPELSQQDSILAAVDAIRRPCWFTAITTFFGFISLLYADVKPVKDFAVVMGVGVIVAFYVSLIFLPAALSLFSATEERLSENSSRSRLLTACAGIAMRHRPLVYAVCLVGLTIAGVGISKLRVDTSFIDYFVEDTDVHQGIKWVDQIGGTMTFEVILPGGPEKMHWLEKENFERITALHDFFDAQPEVGKTMSLVSFERYGRQLLSVATPWLKNVPPKLLYMQLEAQLAAQQTTEGGGGESAAQLEDAVAMVMKPRELDDGTNVMMTRVQVRIRETTVDLRRQEFIDRTEAFLAESPHFDGEERIVTGMFQLFTRMLETVVGSQVRSFGLVFAAVGLLLILLLRHVGAGLLMMLPNVLPIATVLGVMGFADITLDIMTITIASVSLGLAADATIHYVVRFRREVRKSGDFHEACRVAHASIGRAILYAALTVIAGFFVLVLSKFTPTIYFGLLVGIAMVAGILADLILLPALLLTFKPFQAEAGADAGTDA